MIKQVGFTLIELLLSLTLGLIITAAAILLFLTSQKSLSMQQGVADIQDNANFGLNYITKDLRLVNLNNSQSIIKDQTAYGGVVLTSSANAEVDATGTLLSNIFHQVEGNTVNVRLLSRSPGAGMTGGAAPMWTGVSNVQIDGKDVLSDQLTVQYVPQYNTVREGTVDYYDGGFDCEGNALKFRVNKDATKPTEPFGQQVVVQRYFLRLDDNRNANEPNQPLALACDAGYYPVDAPKAVPPAVKPPAMEISRYGDAGEILMKRVDHFRVLLGVQDINNDARRYISINDYMGLAKPHPRIVSMQIGLLARSSQTVGNEKMIKDDQKFVILDQTVTVKDPKITSKYIRQVVSQNIALRNAIGERGQ